MSQLEPLQKKAIRAADKFTTVVAKVGIIAAYVYDTFNEGR